ncbi:MAG: ATP-binding protein, partial [Flavobacterium sp.]
MPEYIWTDYIHLKQVLMNLVSNAVKFTEEGSVSLKVSISEIISESEIKLQFIVKDTGMGFENKNQLKTFDTFSQPGNPTTKKKGGTGLGLPITKKLLELMDSQLELTTKKGEGSEFKFILNVKYDSNLEISNNLLPNKSGKSKEISLDEKTIFIVEDNKINIFLAKTLIKKI